jgi:hypothetical protein
MNRCWKNRNLCKSYTLGSYANVYIMEIMGCSSNIYLWEEAFDLEIKGLN